MNVLLVDEYAPHPKFFCKTTHMGNVTELTAMQKRSYGAPTVRIDKDHYKDLRSGCIHEYAHGETRADNADSVRRTLATVRALINCNVTVPQNCRWLTFTYAENMTDEKRLSADWKKFWQKFKRWCVRNYVDEPEFIGVVEPQGRGAWHMHVFFIWSHTAPYLDNNTVIAPMWGHGFTKTKSVTNCDNVGAYFSAYLGDMPLDEFQDLAPDEQATTFVINEKPVTDQDGQTVTKKIVKGGRLKLYPPGMNIVRSSKGVKRPTVEFSSYEERQKSLWANTDFQSGYSLLVTMETRSTKFTRNIITLSEKICKSDVKSAENAHCLLSILPRCTPAGLSLSLLGLFASVRCIWRVAAGVKGVFPLTRRHRQRTAQNAP